MPADTLPELHDLAHEFMAYDRSLAHPWCLAVEEMQIRSTDSGLLHRNDGIAILLDLGFWDVIDLHFAVRVDDGSHDIAALAWGLESIGIGSCSPE